jgi:hypothetical protein
MSVPANCWQPFFSGFVVDHWLQAQTAGQTKEPFALGSSRLLMVARKFRG